MVLSDKPGQDSYYLTGGEEDEDDEEVVEMDNSQVQHAHYNSREVTKKKIVFDEEERTPEPRKTNPSKFASR